MGYQRTRTSTRYDYNYKFPPPHPDIGLVVTMIYRCCLKRPENKNSPQGLDGLAVVVVVITPPLPRDGGTARTAIQVHAVNLIEIRPGERWQPISNQS